MPFKIVRRKKEIILTEVLEGNNKYGDGLSCNRDWLCDQNTIANFLDFIRKRKKGDDDETQILLSLFPDEALDIQAVLDAQAKAAMKGQPGPLRTGDMESRPAFDDEDEE